MSDEKAFWHALWPFYPPPLDIAAVELLAAAEMTEDCGFQWHVFLMGYGNSIVAIGASVPADFMKAEENYQTFASSVLNRTIAAASMVISSDARLLQISPGQYLSFGLYSDEKLPSTYPVHIEMPSPRVNWDFQTLFHLIGHDGISDDVLGALSEATHGSIPRHYRFSEADRKRSWVKSAICDSVEGASHQRISTCGLRSPGASMPERACGIQAI